MIVDQDLIGRQWLGSQKDSSIFKNERKIPVISKGRCNRCGSRVYASLPSGKRYCRGCIGLGRTVEGDFLIRNEKDFTFSKLPGGGLTWAGKLTPQQEVIAQALVANFSKGRNSLVHAVTGAGKTEMLFPVLAAVLAEGKRACLATPRIDVVNELYPRFTAAFKQIKIGKYHGREYHEPHLERFALCTTHQLLKFYHAFDLLIIDEVDSFPYINNKILHFAAKNAVKAKGCRIYLTATPTADLLKEVRQGTIHILRLKRRFHGGLLPLPREKFFLRPFINSQGLNSHLASEIDKTVKSGHPLLLFVPRIEQIPLYLKALKKMPLLKEKKIAGVYAEDPDRLAKVAAFRANKLQVLVTTTILERGVTFKHVWVIVVSAEDDIYNAASLVQIAGRVGRAKEDPSGLVLFCYRKYTKNIRNAIRQIKEMNR